MKMRRRPDRPRIRVAGIITRGDKILVVNHVRDGKSYCLLPGGGVEWGETCEEALKREFMEELTLAINVGQLVCVNESISPDKQRHILNLNFKVTLKPGQTIKVNHDERLRDACWMDKKTFQKVLFYPEIRPVILKAWEKQFKTCVVMVATPWT